MQRLHITNGDTTARLIEATHIGGRVLPWRDPMHHGPFISTTDLAAQSDVRAHYLGRPPFDYDRVRADFQARDDMITARDGFDEVILWFEHDLLDQLQLLQILDTLARQPRADCAVTLICIGAFAGVAPFRGLGELTPQQLASLFDQRVQITDAHTDLAAAAWSAFCADDPRALHAYGAVDHDALPFLRAALERHFEEYPSATSGLTRTEEQIMQLVANGVSDPVDVFRQNMDLETVLFIGDTPTFTHIARLCETTTPLLAASPTPFRYTPVHTVSRDDLRAQQLTITEAGRAVLDGRLSAFEMLDRDQWLGGVHLASDAGRWVRDDRGDLCRQAA